MPSLTEIFKTITAEAEKAADAVQGLHAVNQGIIEDAEQLSSIEVQATFGTQPPGIDRGVPGTRPPGTLLGPTGDPIQGAATGAGGGSGRRGGGRSGGGGGGGGRSSGGRSIVGETLVAFDTGARMPREWIESFCTLTTLAIPNRLTGFPKEVQAWVCPAPWGTFFDNPAELATISAASEGGVGGASSPSRTSRARMPFPVSGATGSGVGAFENTTPPGPSSRPSASASGSSLGVEQKLDDVNKNLGRTNQLLEQVARGDGGAGLRAGGLL